MKRLKFTLRKVTCVVVAMLTVLLVALFDVRIINAKATADGFYVSGTTIYDANGNPFVMRGINVAHAWYASYTEASIKGIAATGANVVRVVVADGGQWTKTSKSELNNIVNWCKENKLICILEVHDPTGDDNTASLNSATNYWLEMKDVLIGNEKYVILNIANEWFGSWNQASAWADGYINSIKKIREADIHNMIMVDCAGYGQWPDSIKYSGKSVFNADKDKNTVFSIHMYDCSGKDAATVKSNIDNSLGIGVPVVIGEFAADHYGKDVDETTIMNYCEEKKVGYLGWSWKGNSQELASLDVANDWNGTSFTSWGNTLIYGDNGIKNTSSRCTVYTGKTSTETTETTETTIDDATASENYISLFYGSSNANPWNQAVSCDVKKNGGSFDSNYIKKGGHFYVEYTGTQNCVELILQSWSGGSSWGKVEISESGIANGNYYAKFTYDNCVKAFGSSDFVGKLDKIHVGATDKAIKVLSVCYDFGDAYDNNTPSDYKENEKENEKENDPYVSIFWGNQTCSPWAQAASILTTKNGGSFDASAITSNGYFYVEYSGKKNQLELVLQSWSGAEAWAKVSPSETGEAGDHYYAKYSYENCVKAFGTSDFIGKLDQVHIGAAKNTTTFYSLCYCYPR